MSLAQHIIYILSSILFFGIWILPKPIQQLLAIIVYFIVADIIRYRRKVIVNNLKNSFPEKNEKEIRQITRKYYLHLSYMIIEVINLRYSSRKRIAKLTNVETPEILQDMLKKKRNVLLVLGHYGNWEFGSSRVHDFGYRGAAIYKKLTSEAFELFYQKMRLNMGVEPVEMRHTLRKLVAMRNSGEPFALLSVADQTPTRSQIHYWLNFLNQDTGVFMGPEHLAKKFDMPVLYTEIDRLGFCKFNIKLKIITEKPTKEPDYAIINTFYKLLEESINKKPEIWMWSHRRWKHKRPADYSDPTNNNKH